MKGNLLYGPRYMAVEPTREGGLLHLDLGRLDNTLFCITHTSLPDIMAEPNIYHSYPMEPLDCYFVEGLPGVEKESIETPLFNTKGGIWLSAYAICIQFHAYYWYNGLPLWPKAEDQYKQFINVGWFPYAAAELDLKWLYTYGDDPNELSSGCKEFIA